MDHSPFVEYALVDHPELGHMLKDPWNLTSWPAVNGKAQTMAITATATQAAFFSPSRPNNARAMRIPHRWRVWRFSHNAVIAAGLPTAGPKAFIMRLA
ncbi:MAG TPA: hypothetical protein ENJ17_05315 [Gammaproteobacteria bacterium]|nr:hypothetical protein [Gammaproteobacteria bacterium]